MQEICESQPVYDLAFCNQDGKKKEHIQEDKSEKKETKRKWSNTLMLNGAE